MLDCVWGFGVVQLLVAEAGPHELWCWWVLLLVWEVVWLIWLIWVLGLLLFCWVIVFAAFIGLV